MSILDRLEQFGAKLNKALENPIVDHAIDWAGDYVMGHQFWKKSMSGKREISPEWLRTEAPHLWAESHLDENALREITYSAHLAPAWRVALFDSWGPNPAVPNPDPALGQVGRNQWNDIRCSLVEEMFVRRTDHLEPLSGDARKDKLKELCATLEEIARLPNVYKLRRFVRLNYCKAREDDYNIVKLERMRGQTFTSINGLWTGFRSWVTDPAGLAANADLVTAAAQNAKPAVRTYLDSLATTINNCAARTRPNRFKRFFIGS